MMALGALQAFKRAGLSVPGDVSIAGFDDVFVAEFADPPLTTLVQPKYQLGRDAAALMLDLLADGARRAPSSKSIRGELLVRASTAPPRMGA
jgi:LacI family repressor for deo operon, udp, cdd, tsx, nupC, and nupG